MLANVAMWITTIATVIASVATLAQPLCMWISATAAVGIT